MFVGNAWLSEGVTNIDSGVRDVQMRLDFTFMGIHFAYSCVFVNLELLLKF